MTNWTRINVNWGIAMNSIHGWYHDGGEFWAEPYSEWPNYYLTQANETLWGLIDILLIACQEVGAQNKEFQSIAMLLDLAIDSRLELKKIRDQSISYIHADNKDDDMTNGATLHLANIEHDINADKAEILKLEQALEQAKSSLRFHEAELELFAEGFNNEVIHVY